MRNYASETMTCVCRYEGSTLKLNSRPFHYAAYRDGVTNDLYVTVAWEDTTYGTPIESLIHMYLDVGEYRFGAMDGWDDPVAVVPYDEAPDRVFIEKSALAISFTSGAFDVSAVRIYPGQFTSLPALDFSASLYANDSRRLTWTLTPGDDRSGYVTAMYLYRKGEGESEYTAETLYENETKTSYTLTTDQSLLGAEAYLVLEYRTYASDWGGSDLDDFVTLNRLSTAAETVDRDASVPLAPAGITTGMLLDGGKVTVSWTKVSDPIMTIRSYTLERAVSDGSGMGGFVPLYTGSSTQFTDTLPSGAEFVVYRVCSVSGSGAVSEWCATEEMTVIKSNVYVGSGGTWHRAAAVQVGSRRASPMLTAGR